MTTTMTAPAPTEILTVAPATPAVPAAPVREHTWLPILKRLTTKALLAIINTEWLDTRSRQEYCPLAVGLEAEWPDFRIKTPGSQDVSQWLIRHGEPGEASRITAEAGNFIGPWDDHKIGGDALSEACREIIDQRPLF